MPLEKERVNRWCLTVFTSSAVFQQFSTIPIAGEGLLSNLMSAVQGDELVAIYSGTYRRFESDWPWAYLWDSDSCWAACCFESEKYAQWRGSPIGALYTFQAGLERGGPGLAQLEIGPEPLNVLPGVAYRFDLMQSDKGVFVRKPLWWAPVNLEPVSIPTPTGGFLSKTIRTYRVPIEVELLSPLGVFKQLSYSVDLSSEFLKVCLRLGNRVVLQEQAKVSIKSSEVIEVYRHDRSDSPELPVRIVLGELSLSLEEVSRLRVGDALEIAVPTEQEVLIEVAGVPWSAGRLHLLEEALALEISEIIPLTNRASSDLREIEKLSTACSD